MSSPDPEDLTIDNAYKTRWVWYHTILALELLIVNVTLIGILVLLGVKLWTYFILNNTILFFNRIIQLIFGLII